VRKASSSLFQTPAQNHGVIEAGERSPSLFTRRGFYAEKQVRRRKRCFRQPVPPNCTSTRVLLPMAATVFSLLRRAASVDSARRGGNNRRGNRQELGEGRSLLHTHVPSPQRRHTANARAAERIQQVR